MSVRLSLPCHVGHIAMPSCVHLCMPRCVPAPDSMSSHAVARPFTMINRPHCFASYRLMFSILDDMAPGRSSTVRRHPLSIIIRKDTVARVVHKSAVHVQKSNNSSPLVNVWLLGSTSSCADTDSSAILMHVRACPEVDHWLISGSLPCVATVQRRGA